jgi:hypothetical protein
MWIALLLSLAASQARYVDSVVPALTYSRACSTTVAIRNLGDRPVDARLEPHRESGALVELAEQTGMALQLVPGAQKSFTLKIPEATESAWLLVREIVPNGQAPVLAIEGKTGCTAENQLHTAMREVTHASVNPWFDGDVGEMQGARLAVVNTSGAPAIVTGCYSGGTLIANPNVPGGAALVPLCSHEFRQQIPPYSARQYPVEREGNSHFSLHASGRGIALQLLRLLDAGTQLYQVDSSISFGGSSGSGPDR